MVALPINACPTEKPTEVAIDWLEQAAALAALLVKKAAITAAAVLIALPAKKAATIMAAASASTVAIASRIDQVILVLHQASYQ